MVELTDGLNALRWTAATRLIATLDCLPQIVVVYTRNPETGVGFVTFEPGDALSVMKLFVTGVDYLVKFRGSYVLNGASPSPDPFADFPGYAPPVISTAPTAPVGRTETGIAAEPIIGGRLVAQTMNGLLLYSSAVPSHHNLLFGIAMNSALVGGSVTVRRPGYVTYAGWGLPAGTLLLAGADGQLVTRLPATSFYQVIGRSLSSDILLYQPESIILLSNPQTLTS